MPVILNYRPRWIAGILPANLLGGCAIILDHNLVYGVFHTPPIIPHPVSPTTSKKTQKNVERAGMFPNIPGAECKVMLFYCG